MGHHATQASQKSHEMPDHEVPHVSNKTQSRYLTFTELHDMLGGRGRTTIYRDIEKDRLPKPLKIGSRLYWNEADIHAALAALAD